MHPGYMLILWQFHIHYIGISGRLASQLVKWMQLMRSSSALTACTLILHSSSLKGVGHIPAIRIAERLSTCGTSAVSGWGGT